jgi:hypothetical protein
MTLDDSNPDVVIAYRMLIELTEDPPTLDEIGRQAFYDWRIHRKAAEKIIILAAAKVVAMRRASNANRPESLGR